MSTAIVVVAALVAAGWTALAVRLLRLAKDPWSRFLEPVEGLPATSPAVDAVVPARNEEAHIGATVEGLRAQDYPSLTLTVVDDQSTDATATILAKLSSREWCIH